jgi:hypothetical protein
VYSKGSIVGNATLILIIGGLLALSAKLATASECTARTELSQQQMSVLRQAYDLGRQHDLSYSLAAIAWKESSAGKWLVNAQEASYGPFQILLKTAVARTKRDGQTMSGFEQNMLATKLLDIKFSSSYAIQELEYWQGIHGNNWRAIYASYNGGWNHKKPLPQAYAQDIITKMQRLKGCFSEYHVCPHCGG